MDRSFRAGLMLLAGVALLAVALATQAILLETRWWTLLTGAAGAALAGGALLALRERLDELLRWRRAESALFTVGLVGILLCTAYLTARFPLRLDMTEARLHSLSAPTVQMLRRLEHPLHIIFFHDPLMRETVELYEQMATQSDRVTVEFHDPTLNPARARMLGVRFAGTSLMLSGERRLQVHGNDEIDIVNGILRVTQGARQEICFLEGHDEADPFSQESHDHMEGSAGADHSHGLGAKYVLHERHGLAKARASLETLNYTVRTIALTRAGHGLERCALLAIAGPKTALLPGEVGTIRAWLATGGNALFMLDPFVRTGLEPVLRDYGVVLDDTIVMDEASHYWTDASAPAVARYNHHQITRGLALTFYPGARSLSPTTDRVPGTSVIPLVNSSRSSYGEADPERARFDEGVDRRGPLSLMAVALRRPVTANDASAVMLGPKQESREAAVREAMERGASAASRIAVIGDSDFATNSFFHFLGNGNLFLNTVSYLTAQENLIGVEPRTHELPRLSVTNRQMKGTFVLSMALVPGILALVGTAVWWRQR
jgi:hypothetical protein